MGKRTASHEAVPLEVARVKPYYEHAGITIFHSDVREWMASVPACLRFDTVLTDPPYGVGVPYGRFSDTRKLG